MPFSNLTPALNTQVGGDHMSSDAMQKAVQNLSSIYEAHSCRVEIVHWVAECAAI